MLVSGGAKGVRGAHIRAGGVGDALRTYGGGLLIFSIRKHLLEHNTQASRILHEIDRCISGMRYQESTRNVSSLSFSSTRVSTPSSATTPSQNPPPHRLKSHNTPPSTLRPTSPPQPPPPHRPHPPSPSPRAVPLPPRPPHGPKP